MKHHLLFILLTCITGTVSAQLPEDALRYSTMAPSGTARNQAIGGVMGSLGGDISATFVNPAGLGLYKTGEFVITPGLKFLKNKSDFRESAATDKRQSFNLGTTGFVFGYSDMNKKSNSKAISIAVNRTANFNSNVIYQGENNYSSYSEQFAKEVSDSHVWIEDAAASNELSIGSRMAAYTYLIDTATIGGQVQVIGLPEFVSNRLQTDSIRTRGGITEIALGLASNMNDKFYFGGSIGLSIVNYERRTIYTERDATGDVHNNFAFSRFDETNTTKGAGLNAKLGLLFKPVDNLRLGLALHSPNLYNLKDTYHATMVTASEGYVNGTRTVSSDELPDYTPAVYQYNHFNPWKAIISGSFIFHEIEDVTRQKGFISADVEYVNYKAASYQSADENNADVEYYRGVNQGIDELYKGNLNFKFGGELKFNTLMVRAGASFFGSPYKDPELKASRTYFSGGLGYRDRGMFIDLTYVYGINKDVHFPYRLTDKANTFASIKGIGGNALLTFGLKF